jgi:hypothetical protein
MDGSASVRLANQFVTRWRHVVLGSTSSSTFVGSVRQR